MQRHVADVEDHEAIAARLDHPSARGARQLAAFTDVDEFKERMDWYLREMEATPPAPGYDRVMTPGLEEAEMEVERNAKGIPLHTEVVGWLEQICEELNIPKDYLEAPTPMP